MRFTDGPSRQASGTDEKTVSVRESPSLIADRAEQGAVTSRTEGRSEKLLHAEVTGSIIASFFAAYDKLGYGFLENVYRGALVIELQRRGHHVAREVRVPVMYDGVRVALYKMDFVVDDAVVIEVKSTASLNSADYRQLLNYLRATRFEVGLLLHFGPKPKFQRLVASAGFHRR